MAIVTLLTDSGESDFYAAAIKAKILEVNPGIRLVDLSHQVRPCDLAHAAYILRSVFRFFPKGTVHLLGVDATGNRGDGFMAVQLEDHFFVCADNGLLGLVSEKSHQQIAEINTVNPIITTFPEREILAPAAAKLASGVSITDLGRPMTGFKRMIDRQVKATKKQISGHVIHVDTFGNLITNIPKTAFDVLSQGKSFTVQFAGEKFRKIQSMYHQGEQGDCVILFNSAGFLEIAIYKGNASELLGLSYDSVVNILFDE